MSTGPFFRAFRWDPDAAEGDRFSAAFVPSTQGNGRFDLPGDPAGVLYLAETPDQAIGEKIQRYRGHQIDDADLFEAGRRLAVATVHIDERIVAAIPDLCRPQALDQFSLTADQLAVRDRARTQAIAARLDADGHHGLHWWSAFFGEWHAWVLFRRRLPPGSIRIGEITPVTLDFGPLLQAAELLGIDVAVSPPGTRQGEIATSRPRPL